MDNIPLISLLFLTLPVGAALAWLLPRPESSRVIALACALIDLVIALVALFVFDPNTPGFQLLEKRNWIPSLNIHYLVGVDGISITFSRLQCCSSSASSSPPGTAYIRCHGSTTAC